MTTLPAAFEFALDAARHAAEPPEVRGTGRDDVRLLVTDRRTGDTDTRHFRDLPEALRPGDLLVVNNSTTLPAAVWLDRMVVHFSTRQEDGRWLVEPRRRVGRGHVPHADVRAGEHLPLPGGVTLRLAERYSRRLWFAELDTSVPIYLMKHGKPIRYDYVGRDWPLSAYQTVFGTVDGSAEMPSAARPFTADMVTALVSRGIGIAPVTLHTGVASPEADEPPYPEWFQVTPHTAAAVRAAKSAGGRVIAVGTTVVRALESAAASGTFGAAEGTTSLVVTPERGVHVVDGIVTGLHEPRSTHLAMLSAVADAVHLRHAYREAIAHGLLWHEFGDLHLIALSVTSRPGPPSGWHRSRRGGGRILRRAAEPLQPRRSGHAARTRGETARSAGRRTYPPPSATVHPPDTRGHYTSCCAPIPPQRVRRSDRAGRAQPHDTPRRTRPRRDPGRRRLPPARHLPGVPQRFTRRGHRRRDRGGDRGRRDRGLHRQSRRRARFRGHHRPGRPTARRSIHPGR
ncbi:hypothetical protein GCM10023223_06000 [Stackebrandtia albiflava]|nr:S-adenosylmethionine:tRNA ribosyltransferase-isomerase [Stackebrandtia albiflava]